MKEQFIFELFYTLNSYVISSTDKNHKEKDEL